MTKNPSTLRQARFIRGRLHAARVPGKVHDSSGPSIFVIARHAESVCRRSEQLPGARRLQDGIEPEASEVGYALPCGLENRVEDLGVADVANKVHVGRLSGADETDHPGIDVK